MIVNDSAVDIDIGLSINDWLNVNAIYSIPDELSVDDVLSDQSVIHEKGLWLDSEKSIEETNCRVFYEMTRIRVVPFERFNSCICHPM